MNAGRQLNPASLGSVAIALDTEDGRAFLQSRLAAFGRFAFIISFFFFVTGNILAVALNPPPGTKPLLVSSNLWHAGALCVSATLWLALRRGRYSVGIVHAADLFHGVAVCTAYAVMSRATMDQGNTRPDMLVLLIFMTLLVLRAVLVPSSWQQTALVSLVCCTPAIWVAWQVGLRAAAEFPNAELFVPINTALWSLSIAATSTLTSSVIYGLRERAAEAQRLGQYELLGKLGEGGMGVVYRARHALLRRPTAVKVLLPERAGDNALSRFEREVRQTARLTHPNTVAIFDYGRTPEGLFYYAMELLDGIDLERLVELDGPQPPGRVVHVLQQACGSLAEAHAMGLVHRDIKPANLIICERGGIPDTVKVVDFGLVKEVEGAAADPKLSTTTALIGTPLYLSPEAITKPDSVGPRSDLYALGAVGYFLLTGKPVFDGETVMEVCAGHLHEAPTPPSQRLGSAVPKGLEEILLACLAKEPSARPENAASLRRLLLDCTVSPWTEDDALIWWDAHRSLSRRSEKPRDDDAPVALTVHFAERMSPSDSSSRR